MEDETTYGELMARATSQIGAVRDDVTSRSDAVGGVEVYQAIVTFEELPNALAGHTGGMPFPADLLGAESLRGEFFRIVPCGASAEWPQIHTPR